MKAIFAVDIHNGIGKNGTLPWPKNKEDFAWFKKHTLGKTVVMGRNTWDDPAFPKPLPKRVNMVITRKPIDVEGVLVKDSIDDIPDDAVIIGGARLIASFAEQIDTIYLTRFPDDHDCDTFIDLDTLLDDFAIVERIQSKKLAFEVWKRCNNT